MIIGYGRHVGRPDPASIDQIRQNLITAGAETVFLDANPLWLSAETAFPTPGLDAAIAAAQPGDAVLSLTPTHLVASLGELIVVARKLAEKGASLRVLTLAGGQTLDTATPSGAMLLAAISLMSAFETKSPQATQNGASPISRLMPPIDSFAPRRPRGRPPTASTQAEEISRLRTAGMRATDIADRLQICRASVYRVLNLTTMPVTQIDEPIAETLPSRAPERTMNWLASSTQRG